MSDSTNNAVNESKLFQVMGLGPLWEPRDGNAQGPQQPVAIDGGPPSNESSAGELSVEGLQEVKSSLPTLEELAIQVSSCQACGLCKTRKQTVFSAGVARSDLMVIGEAPGADEDAQGEPFVGRAGQLLDKMLKAVDRSRSQNVYIANVLKCRPPGNRNPEPAEIASCSPYLMQQIELSKPKALLLVGSFAIRTLLNTQDAVGKVRGRVHQVQVGGITLPTVASYHPAYLLRNPVEKRKSWEDLQLLQSLLKA
ncbi:MAG: uracil-DNA glycosylase [Limnobacter sp.]|nr:uracil-DNA glycosylase [Limnobacter sp.]